MTDLPSVLVLDGRQRAALAITRSLGRRGVAVHVAEARGTFSLAGTSRYCVGQAEYAPVTESALGLAADVQALADRLGCRWIWPVTDATTMLVCAEPGLQARLLCSDGAGYAAASDKAGLVARADRLGVPVPATRIAHDAAQVRAAVAAFGYPCVLKPARSKYVAEGRVRATQVRPLETAADLERALIGAAWLEHMPALVQAFVPGHGEGVFCLFDGADAIAWFAHRRVREKPPSGGVSVLSEAATAGVQLRDHAARLLADIGYHGLAMVEFRVGAEPALMEINARPWGSLQLAIDAGIDFPWLQYCLRNHLPLPSTAPRPARLRWFLGDVDHLLLQLKRPLAGSSRVGALAAFLATTMDGSARNEVLRPDDLRPAFAEFREWLHGR